MKQIIIMCLLALIGLISAHAETKDPVDFKDVEKALKNDQSKTRREVIEARAASKAANERLAQANKKADDANKSFTAGRGEVVREDGPNTATKKAARKAADEANKRHKDAVQAHNRASVGVHAAQKLKPALTKKSK